MLPLKQTFADCINFLFSNLEPWQICATTVFSVALTVWIWDKIFDSESLYNRIKIKAFRMYKKLPFMSKIVNEELQEMYQMFENEVKRTTNKLPYCLELPLEKSSSKNILETVKSHLSIGKYDWKGGALSGTVYYYDEELANLASEAFKLTLYTNPLHQDVFPGICKMEAEIIRIVLDMFHADDNGCGVMTSGGTESIIMACKAYRDYAKEIRGIKYPEIVLPRSAHVAFDKASSYLGMRLKQVDIDTESTCVNINAMRKAINKNTVMLVGSSPNFPYGTADDIVEIAKLGQKYSIPVHVDCCLGSFVVAFMKEAGYETPLFDFSLPGVPSMSVDTHKYGFAPKGSSLILYSDRKYRRFQFHACSSWIGGLYASPSVSGSRSGATIATCWATMMYFGKEGYIDALKKIMDTSKYIETQMRSIPGIFVFGKPFSTVIALGSNEFHIYKLSDSLNKKKWNLNLLQFPLGIHICITYLHTLPGVAERFVGDVRIAVEQILSNPKEALGDKVAMYGTCTTLPDRSLVTDFTKCYLDAVYYTPKKFTTSSN